MFRKNCPKCKAIQTYSTKYLLAKAIKSNQQCRRCVKIKDYANTNERICNVCKKTKPFVCFYEIKSGKRKGKRDSRCGECRRIDAEKYRKSNNGKIKRKLYVELNREEQNKKQRERYKLIDIKLAKKQYRKNHTDQTHKYNKVYRQEMKEKILAHNRNRKAAQKKVDQNYTPEDALFTKILFDNQCFNCHSKKQLCIDHHRPLIKGYGLSKINAVLLCQHCNCSKGAIDPEDFYTKKQLKSLYKLGIK